MPYWDYHENPAGDKFPRVIVWIKIQSTLNAQINARIDLHGEPPAKWGNADWHDDFRNFQGGVSPLSCQEGITEHFDLETSQEWCSKLLQVLKLIPVGKAVMPTVPPTAGRSRIALFCDRQNFRQCIFGLKHAVTGKILLSAVVDDEPSGSAATAKYQIVVKHLCWVDLTGVQALLSSHDLEDLVPFQNGIYLHDETDRRTAQLPAGLQLAP